MWRVVVFVVFRRVLLVYFYVVERKRRRWSACENFMEHKRPATDSQVNPMLYLPLHSHTSCPHDASLVSLLWGLALLCALSKTGDDGERPQPGGHKNGPHRGRARQREKHPSLKGRLARLWLAGVLLCFLVFFLCVSYVKSFRSGTPRSTPPFVLFGCRDHAHPPCTKIFQRVFVAGEA